tara:strand:- start:617 stop:790 length:174 start_codon:yes stop_codon:yes gene_type:complete
MVSAPKQRSQQGQNPKNKRDDDFGIRPRKWCAASAEGDKEHDDGGGEDERANVVDLG